MPVGVWIGTDVLLPLKIAPMMGISSYNLWEHSIFFWLLFHMLRQNKRQKTGCSDGLNWWWTCILSRGSRNSMWQIIFWNIYFSWSHFQMSWALMKIALNAAISAIVGIICQLVWLEKKEYGGVPSRRVAYWLQHGVFNWTGCGSCPLVYEKKVV